jgi:PAS domain S-box-containing protein
VGDRGRPLSGSEAPARRRKAGDGATLDWPRDGNEAVAAVAQSFEPAVARLHHSRNREAEQARQLHDVLDSTSAAIIAIDADGRIEHANRAADRRFGAAQDALIGTSVETLMRPGTRPPPRRAFARDRHGRRAGPHQHRPRGDRAQAEWRPVPHQLEDHDAAARPRPRLHWVVEDLSDPKQQERMQREFLSTVSHELRIPSAAIKGAMTLVESGLVGDIGDETRQITVMARKNCERLIRLINDLLDMERLEAGRFEFKRRRVDLREVLNNAAALSAQVVYAAKAELSSTARPWARRW